jgi:hypothetical protein
LVVPVKFHQSSAATGFEPTSQRTLLTEPSFAVLKRRSYFLFFNSIYSRSFARLAIFRLSFVSAALIVHRDTREICSPATVGLHDARRARQLVRTRRSQLKPKESFFFCISIAARSNFGKSEQSSVRVCMCLVSLSSLGCQTSLVSCKHILGADD